MQQESAVGEKMNLQQRSVCVPHLLNRTQSIGALRQRRGMRLSHRETVNVEPVISERFAAADNSKALRVKRELLTGSAEISGSYECPSAHGRVNSIELEPHTNSSKLHGPHRVPFIPPYILAKLPACCKQNYRWVPLHTSCSKELIAEHEGLIEWFIERYYAQLGEGKCSHDYTNADDQVLRSWLIIAKGRCQALSDFVQNHRKFYDGIDMEELQSLEVCLQMLVHSVEEAQKIISARTSQSPASSCTHSSRDVNMRAYRSGKRVAFADPLCEYFPLESARNSCNCPPPSLSSTASGSQADELALGNPNNSFFASTSDVVCGDALNTLEKTSVAFGCHGELGQEESAARVSGRESCQQALTDRRRSSLGERTAEIGDSGSDHAYTPSALLSSALQRLWTLNVWSHVTVFTFFCIFPCVFIFWLFS
uniref:Uncharacterized protein n=1 Tax=Trypanosoma congolense (strain IL3000) TaxID=1068625 RepID=G0UYI6_TRYCI|nr:conserved hypothetical protein [Trypanosoma congolense IL3000]